MFFPDDVAEWAGIDRIAAGWSIAEPIDPHATPQRQHRIRRWARRYWNACLEACQYLDWPC